MRIKDPVRSEQGMFELLLWVMAIVAVLVVRAAGRSRGVLDAPQ